MLKEHIERNKQIAIDVLLGATYQSKADQHNISKNRVRQITYKMVRLVYLEMKCSLGKYFPYRTKIERLRDFFAPFVNRIRVYEEPTAKTYKYKVQPSHDKIARYNEYRFPSRYSIKLKTN